MTYTIMVCCDHAGCATTVSSGERMFLGDATKTVRSYAQSIGWSPPSTRLGQRGWRCPSHHAHAPAGRRRR